MPPGAPAGVAPRVLASRAVSPAWIATGASAASITCASSSAALSRTQRLLRELLHQLLELIWQLAA
eukprot:5592475-Pyramimonas_sp.AAC.1